MYLLSIRALFDECYLILERCVILLWFVCVVVEEESRIL